MRGRCPVGLCASPLRNIYVSFPGVTARLPPSRDLEIHDQKPPVCSPCWDPNNQNLPPPPSWQSINSDLDNLVIGLPEGHKCLVILAKCRMAPTSHRLPVFSGLVVPRVSNYSPTPCAPHESSWELWVRVKAWWALFHGLTRAGSDRLALPCCALPVGSRRRDILGGCGVPGFLGDVPRSLQHTIRTW